MIEYCIAISLPAWAKSALQSVWTYAAIAAVFAAILVVALILLLRPLFSNKQKNKVRVYSTPEKIPEDELTSLVLSLRESPRTVLMAAAGLNCMPVTIPIRLAVQLAATGKRCLLIDLDTRRDAIARVFNISPQSPDSFEPASTDVKNIHLIAAHAFGGSKHMHIQALIRSAEKKYDAAIISAPYLDGHPDRRQIAAAAKHAILFVQTPVQMERLDKVCHASRCKVLGRYQTEETGETALSQ